MLGNPKVNLLVLDVEGAELKVLHTLPWDEVRHFFLASDPDPVWKKTAGSG